MYHQGPQGHTHFGMPVHHAIDSATLHKSFESLSVGGTAQKLDAAPAYRNNPAGVGLVRPVTTLGVFVQL